MLVSGTVIYSKGDDRDVEKMAAEEIASQGTPPATGQVTRLPAGSVAVPGSSGAAPVHIVGSAAGKVRLTMCFDLQPPLKTPIPGDDEHQPVFHVPEALVRGELASVWALVPRSCGFRGSMMIFHTSTACINTFASLHSSPSALLVVVAMAP